MKKILIFSILLISFASFGQSLATYSLPSASGTDTYSYNPTTPITLTNGATLRLHFTNANTGAATLNISSTGAKPLRDDSGTTLSAGDIEAGSDKWVVYNLAADQWRLMWSAESGTTYNFLTPLNESGGNVSINTGGANDIFAMDNSATNFEFKTIQSPLTVGTAAIGIQNSAADGSTKGAASFNSSDFDAISGNISLDYTNGQSASGSTKGFLTATDFNTFNGKSAAFTNSAGLRSLLSDELGTGAALFDGATPTSLVGTNITGTASGLTAGNVTTNANLTGTIVSTGNATSFGTMSAPNTLTGSSTNTLKHVFPNLGTTQTDGAGLWLANTTSGVAGSQYSPSITIEAHGKETTTNTDKAVLGVIDMTPTDGASYATGTWRFRSKMNAGAVNTTPFTLTTEGLATLTSAVTSTVFTVTNGTNNLFRVNGNASGRIYLGSTAYIESVTNGTGTASLTGLSLALKPDAGVWVVPLSSIVTNSSNTTFNKLGSRGEGTSGSTAHEGLLLESTLNYPTGSQIWRNLRIKNVRTSVAGLSAEYGVTTDANTLNGFNTETPNSTLQVSGSLSTAYVAKTALYTLTGNDYTVEVTSGTHTQTLPTAVGITGRIYCVTNSGSGVVTLATTSSQTFANITTTPTTRTFIQFSGGCYQSNGANWIKLNEY